jgi:hypothetical protein
MHDSVLTVRQNDLIRAPKVIIAKELPAAPIGGSRAAAAASRKSLSVIGALGSRVRYRRILARATLR